MAVFPIQYAEATPSGRGPSVRTNIDVDTGAGAIGQAVSGLGGAMFDVGMKIRNTQDLMEESSRIKDIEELGNEGNFALTEEPDTAKHPEIIARYNNQINSISGSNDRVNQKLKLTKDKFLPQWNVTAQQTSNRIKIANLKSEAIDLENYYYGNGELGNFIDLQAREVAGGIKDKKQAKIDIRDFPINTTLLQARITLDTDPNRAVESLSNPEFRKKLSGDQLDKADHLLGMAKQRMAINTDQIQNEVVFGMFDNRNKTLVEKNALGTQYINKLRTTPGLSREDTTVMTTRIENWMVGKQRTNDSLVSSKLFTEITQLHRGLGKTEEVKRKIMANFDNLDDSHFESLNKYVDETVEEWNADTLRRLEKEAIPHLAPRLSMLEKFMELSATPGISTEQKAKYDSLIERLQEPAKVDADRLALYLNQNRKWIVANPTAPNFYENGRRIMAQFERYTDDQIRQMESQLEGEGFGTETVSQTKIWKYTIIKKETGERMGSDDGVIWTLIP